MIPLTKEAGVVFSKTTPITLTRYKLESFGELLSKIVLVISEYFYAQTQKKHESETDLCKINLSFASKLL